MKGIWTYIDFWPECHGQHLITMGEGQTPLIKCDRLSQKYGLSALYLKLENNNPTGSYKDRFAAAALTHIVNAKMSVCIATSSGNTGAALAAYSARANVPCYIIVVDGAPAGKMNQMRLYGAETLMVKDFGLNNETTNQVIQDLTNLCEKLKTSVQISAYAYTPMGMKGVESIAFEIAESLPLPGLQVFSPAGGGGLTLAVGRGFQKWQNRYPDYPAPNLHCVQPVGNNTIAGPLRSGAAQAVAVAQSLTKVSGLQVPSLIDGQQTLEVCRALQGSGQTVSDEWVFEIQKDLAQLEGVYAEPAGAVALAGAIQAARQGEISSSDPILCLVTGHGFKDENSISRILKGDPPYLSNIKEVENYILNNK